METRTSLRQARTPTARYRCSSIEAGGRLRRAATYLTGFESFGVAMGDVNSDGKVDLVTAQRGGKPLSVLLGRGTGRFRIAHHYRGTSANGLGLGDFNGDGNLDVALAATRRRVSVRLGRGDGTFGSARSYASGREPWDVTVADLNGDATPDLVVGDYAGGSVWVHLAVGDGTFVVGRRPDGRWTGRTGPRSRL
jgi:FG-GAP-like repeat